MATELDQNYCGWSHQDLIGQEDSQDVAIAQMLDQGSISFGRYAVESLAWEKRSVFTHNRCQEELEKLRAPGLVAQKKAYFEAYYKRIRAMKALQANEQTELVVEYGGDDSSSCKNGELEDENVGHETVRNSATSVASACLEEHAAEDALEMESSSAFCCKYLDPKPVVICPDFSTRTTEGDADFMSHLNNDMISEPAGAFTDSSTASFKEIDVENYSIDSLQCGHLDPETSISYDDSWREGIEDAALKNDCCSPQKTGHMSTESTLLDSPRRVEEIELLKSLCSDDDNDDDGWNVKKAGEAQHTIDNGTSTELSGPDSLMLKNISDLPPVGNHINRKAKGLFNKVNHSSTPRIKESASSVKKTEIMERKTNSEAVKASRQPKQLLQRTLVVEEKNANASNAPSGRLQSKNKSTSNTPYRPDKVHSRLTVVKEGNKIHLSSAECQRLPRENKSASVSSSRLHKGLPSNGIGSCPISFATKRWPTNPCGSRESGRQNSCSKSLNESIHASKQLSMQSTSVKRHAANGVKSAGLGKKSYYGETPKAASVLNSRTAVPRASNGLLQRPEARSNNLPAVSEHSLSSRAGSGLKGERKEGESNARRRLFEGTSKTLSAAPVRSDKSNLRKQVSSQTAGLVLDGKKSRQAAKPWR